jgi:hypothetical protein
MKRFLLGIISICLFLAACKDQPNPNVWTKGYEQGLYDYLEARFKPDMPDAKKRLKFIQFYIKRVKEEIPNGINSVSKDSLQSLDIRIGQEYVQGNGTGNVDIKPYYEAWSPLLEKTFRYNYNAFFQEKYPNTTGKFCDCVINKLKIMYPDSLLVPVPKDINLQVTNDCKSILGPPQ